MEENREKMVLGILGSPRIKGNTDLLLERVLAGAESSGVRTEKIVLNSLKFAPCQECKVMNDDGTCLIKDDMKIVYQKVNKADAVILASPIFFGSLSAQTKMMIDRFQCLWRAKFLLGKELSEGKIGAFICVEASDRRDFFTNARAIAKNFFAVIGARYIGDLFCPGVDEKGAIIQQPECLKKGLELGKKIADAVRESFQTGL